MAITPVFQFLLRSQPQRGAHRTYTCMFIDSANKRCSTYTHRFAFSNKRAAKLDGRKMWAKSFSISMSVRSERVHVHAAASSTASHFVDIQYSSISAPNTYSRYTT